MSRDQATGFAPVIQGQNLEGEWQRIQTRNFSKPVLIYFFAEWCPICKVQHGVISSLNDQYPVMGIAMQSGDIKNVRRYVTEQGLSFPVINDREGSISRAFGVQGVPASFIIDQQGKIRFSTRGYATFAGLWIRLWFTETFKYAATG